MAELLKADKLAVRLGVAYSTVLVWRRRGWIHGRRAIGPGGGCLVFDLAEVMQDLNAHGERVLLPVPAKAGDGSGKAVNRGK